MNKSVWSEHAKDFQFDSLKKDINCKVLVIGGGMAGILTAHYLKQKGVDVVVAEGKTIGDGITQKSTGVITAQHDTSYPALAKMHSKKSAAEYLEANLWAVEEFERLNEEFPCDFERKSSFMFSANHHFCREANLLQSFGFKPELRSEIDLPIKIEQALEFPNMAQIHPLKLLYAVAKNLPIYENTFIRKVKGSTAYTSRGKIHAEHIVIATHFPFINTSGLFFAKMYQMRSYVVAFANTPQINGTYVDTSSQGLYFRNYGDLLLIGGSDHRTGTNGGGYKKIRDFAAVNFPQAVEKYAWATQDCMSLDGLPYIGRYGKRKRNIYVASGFNEWGMTGSLLSAAVLSDLIAGKENKYAGLFNPSRSLLRKQLFANLFTTLFNFLIPSVKRCPHLGCALKYNKRERSWDCACHGSRFLSDGKLVDNPAMKDAKV